MELSRKELEKVVKWLSDLQRDVEEINDKLDYIMHNESEPYSISAYDLDGAICLLYEDCLRCPLSSACDFYILECTKPKDCSTCPKIKVCASRRNPALIAYLMSIQQIKDLLEFTRLYMAKLMKDRFLRAREHVLKNISKIPQPDDFDRWYSELDEDTRIGLVALSAERRLKLQPGTDEWAEKVKDLLEGNCWWEELDLICPATLWEIVLEVREEQKRR
jgi:hypothetical protein